MPIPPLFQRRRTTHLRLIRVLAGLLLLQSLAPFLAYGIMTPADDEPALSWCSARGASSLPADTRTGPTQHFKCPACLFYGQLACGAGATDVAVLPQQFNSTQPPVNGVVPPVVPATVNIRHIRAPPAAI